MGPQCASQFSIKDQQNFVFGPWPLNIEEGEKESKLFNKMNIFECLIKSAARSIFSQRYVTGTLLWPRE